jgi:hypothetical protein
MGYINTGKVCINALEISRKEPRGHLEYGISDSRTPMTAGIATIVYWYAALVKDQTVKSQAMYV